MLIASITGKSQKIDLSVWTVKYLPPVAQFLPLSLLGWRGIVVTGGGGGGGDWLVCLDR